MSRFTPIEMDDGPQGARWEIWDSQRSDLCHVSFPPGPVGHDMAHGCADVWNQLVAGILDGTIPVVVPDCLPEGFA